MEENDVTRTVDRNISQDTDSGSTISVSSGSVQFGDTIHFNFDRRTSYDSLDSNSPLFRNPNPDHDVTTLELALKLIYQQLALPHLAWLDNGMDLSLSLLYMKLQLDTDSSYITLEEIFNNQSNRILIEGKPGFGKTTACIKLIFDWANDATYTQQFKLAFLIPLKSLPENGDIDESLNSILQIKDVDVIKTINTAGQKVLIVLDGFDELTKRKKQNVLRVLYRQKYGKATIILTCRINEFYIQKEDLELIFGSTAFSREFANAKYFVSGIKDVNEVIKFIDNISQQYNVKANECIDHLKSIVKYNSELFQCPLFVTMYMFLASSNQNVADFNTNTKLYCALFNCIIKHSLTKNNVPISNKFDIFDINDDSSKQYRENLREFGQSIISNSMEFSLQFESNNHLTEEVYKMGLLVKHRRMLLYAVTSHYEVFHKSILEFLVAYSIWHRCAELNYYANDEIIKTVVFTFLQHSSSHILEYVWGLWENFAIGERNILDVLEFFKSYAVYWNVEDVLWALCSRNKSNANLVRRFCDFMPFYCYAPSMSTDELKVKLTSGHIKTVCLFVDDNTILPKVLIPELRLIVTDERVLGNQTFVHLQDVCCSNFILDFQFRKIDSEVFQACLHSISLVHSNRNIIINFNSESLVSVCNVDGIKIDQIECNLAGNEIQDFHNFKCFTEAFKTNSIIKCEVMNNNFKTEKVISYLPTCADHMGLLKNGDRVVFDFKDLTISEREEWYQRLKGDEFSDETNYKTINYLYVNSPNRELLLSILNFTSSYILRSLFTHFTIALESLPNSWPGFTNLQELSLICDDQSSTLWEEIKKLKNLQSLELQMICKLETGDHVEALANCVLSHCINHLSLHIELKDDIIFINKFVEKYKNLLISQCGLNPLNVISITSVINPDIKIVTELLKCVKLKLLSRVQFIVSPDVWLAITRQIDFDYSLFQISFVERGGKPDDSSTLPIIYSRPADEVRKIKCIQINLK